MANYSILDGQITSNIYTNGVQAITGAVLQGVLLDMVTSLGKHYQFGGVALPAGVFTAGDENVAFFAYTAGTYTNYGGFTLNGNSLHVLTYKGSWTDTDTGIPTGDALTAAIAAALASVDNDYAKKVGFYPRLVSGGTQSVLGAIQSLFFRSVHTDRDGMAKITNVKGSAFKFNQLVKDITSSDNLMANGASTIAWDDVNNRLNITFGGNDSATAVGIKTGVFVPGHKLYVKIAYTGVAPTNLKFSSTNGVGGSGDTRVFSASNAVITLSTFTQGTVGSIWLWGTAGDMQITAITVVDLTAAEIDTYTTTAQVEAWLLDYMGKTSGFDFNAGSVITFKAVALNSAQQNGDEYVYHTLTPTGWKDDDGNYIFPNGMVGIGSVTDVAKVSTDGHIRKAERRFARVDLGTLDWNIAASPQYGAYVLGPSDIKPASGNSTVANIICKNRKAVSFNNIYSSSNDAGKICVDTAGYIEVSTTKTTRAEVQAELSGVYLYYEIATPEDIDIATDVSAFVPIFEDGVLEIAMDVQLEDTAPCSFDIQMPDGAFSDGSIKNLLDALKTAGVISAYTMTWDADTASYQFTITA